MCDSCRRRLTYVIAKGTGMAWLTEHDMTFRGDFPVNTAGGQLSFGQAGRWADRATPR